MKKTLISIIFLLIIVSCGNKLKNINETKTDGIEITDLQLIDDLLYRYGEEKEYSGKVISRYENGNILSIETVKNGKVEGQTTTYYEDGKLKEEYPGQ